MDEVDAYKRSSKVYRHVARRLGRSLEKVWLISSNAVIGAEAVGMRAAWANRSGGLFDALDQSPDMVVGALTELAGGRP